MKDKFWTGLQNFKEYRLPVAVSIFIFELLAIVQVKLSLHPIILLGRFITGGGWFEIMPFVYMGHL